MYYAQYSAQGNYTASLGRVFLGRAVGGGGFGNLVSAQPPKTKTERRGLAQLGDTARAPRCNLVGVVAKIVFCN